MARTARFFLLLVQQLAEILPELRVFAFSSELGEISDRLRQADSALAIEEAMFTWGNGNTDYGKAFVSLRRAVRAELNHRATIVVLGDARSNFYPPRADVLHDLASRVRRVIWLNPEGRADWGSGDSEMLRYRAHCQHAYRLASLKDLQRVTTWLVDN